MVLSLGMERGNNMLDIIVEKLIHYAQMHLSLDEQDVLYTRNLLLFKLNIERPYKGIINISEIKAMKTPDSLFEELRAEIMRRNLTEEWRIEGLLTDVMGLLTPSPKLVTDKFRVIYKKDKKAATDYLLDLGIASNYIQKSKIEQNIKWESTFDDKRLEITINLAKPEKDNRQIAEEIKKGANQTDEYPSCPLCKENVGFGGNFKIPPRQNLRVIPLKLDNNENWFLQYSPYMYYDRHCIVVFDEHLPMVISPRTFANLLSFSDQFPHFFIGSNSDLPIVGGSILSHEHFQGGAPVMPMFETGVRQYLKARYDKRVEIGILDWFTSVVFIKSANKKLVLEYASKITEKWIDYRNEELGIIPHTQDDRHNTVTPIVRKVKNNYYFYLILRNNRTDETYPDGIFHAHPEYHNIKKEGIGLIEQMGIFILPARLKRQLALIEKALETKVDVNGLIDDNPDLAVHRTLIDDLSDLTSEKKIHYDKEIRNYVSDVCRNVLINTAVFKDDVKGQAAFYNFLKSIKY